MTKNSLTSALTDSESEASTSYNNNHNINLIVNHIAKLEAENARLQTLLINSKVGVNEQTKPINKRKLIVLSDDNSNHELIISKEKKNLNKYYLKRGQVFPPTLGDWAPREMIRRIMNNKREITRRKKIKRTHKKDSDEQESHDSPEYQDSDEQESQDSPEHQDSDEHESQDSSSDESENQDLAFSFFDEKLKNKDKQTKKQEFSPLPKTVPTKKPSRATKTNAKEEFGSLPETVPTRRSTRVTKNNSKIKNLV
ncbi:6333_t:CDS:2 [Funneliformis caledonium]|uniref:6333_t:CDS:1 n=1 Tax=Funneliformis caledonium TaxID=1117310 RepID=A0A9N9EHU6_9GLOM|nr:6333_t:CDS:2 [Funneliformis caledonium]